MTKWLFRCRRESLNNHRHSLHAGVCLNTLRVSPSPSRTHSVHRESLKLTSQVNHFSLYFLNFFEKGTEGKAEKRKKKVEWWRKREREKLHKKRWIDKERMGEKTGNFYFIRNFNTLWYKKTPLHSKTWLIVKLKKRRGADCKVKISQINFSHPLQKIRS